MTPRRNDHAGWRRESEESRAEVTQAQPQPGDGSAAARTAKRILVVEDQDEPRRVLARALTSFGYELELARDGIEGLAKLNLEIDLVLLDASMPGMDGFELARQIREHSTYGDLPIIMV